MINVLLRFKMFFFIFPVLTVFSVFLKIFSPKRFYIFVNKYLDLLTVDQNLCGLYVLRHQQLSIDICCPRPPSAANPLDERTDGRTLHRFMTLTAYYAGRVIMRVYSTWAEMNWTVLQQVDPVRWHVIIIGYISIVCSETRTVGARLV